MPDVPSTPPAQTPPTTPAQPAEPAAPAGPTINIGEEYGTAKKNLPPTKIVLIAIGAVVVVVLIASFLKRAQPQGRVTTSSGESTADAVSSVDFERYFQAFPALKEGAQLPLAPEVRLEVGQSVSRTIIVVFPVPLDAFQQRKSVSAVIWPYNYTVPIVLTK